MGIIIKSTGIRKKSSSYLLLALNSSEGQLFSLFVEQMDRYFHLMIAS